MCYPQVWELLAASAGCCCCWRASYWTLCAMSSSALRLGLALSSIKSNSIYQRIVRPYLVDSWMYKWCLLMMTIMMRSSSHVTYGILDTLKNIMYEFHNSNPCVLEIQGSQRKLTYNLEAAITRQSSCYYQVPWGCTTKIQRLPLSSQAQWPHSILGSHVWYQLDMALTSS